jgi:hypothetical protein
VWKEHDGELPNRDIEKLIGESNADANHLPRTKSATHYFILS